ncbi:MIEAP domain-containing protein [Trichonephila clavipes]|nr:MIEAP domain-containing protein [Trichonephila clavipes]
MNCLEVHPAFLPASYKTNKAGFASNTIHIRLHSRSNNSGCSSDPHSESGKSSSRNKQKPVTRNGATKVSPNQDSKSSCSVTLHVPDAQSTASVDSNNSAWKILALNAEIESLRAELDQAKGAITTLKENEQRLKSRLAEQAQRMLERGARFENLCLGENRPTALIRQYGNLYAQARIDTLDSLDTLAPLRDADELKTKILFSVIALSFRSVHTTLSDMKDQIYSILQAKDMNENDIALNELENGISVYLRKTTKTFNLTKNVHVGTLSNTCIKIIFV